MVYTLVCAPKCLKITDYLFTTTDIALLAVKFDATLLSYSYRQTRIAIATDRQE